MPPLCLGKLSISETGGSGYRASHLPHARLKLFLLFHLSGVEETESGSMLFVLGLSVKATGL